MAIGRSPEAIGRAMAKRDAAQARWPKSECPGRGRTHSISSGSSMVTACPWCIPLDWYIAVEKDIEENP